MMRFVLTLLVCLQVQILFSKVDTLFVYSEVMDQSIPISLSLLKIINKQKNLPSSLSSSCNGGYFSNWMFRVPEIEKYASDYGIIIICPDGNKQAGTLTVH